VATGVLGRIGGVLTGKDRGHVELIDEPAADEETL
jgi:hypothetical protein